MSALGSLVVKLALEHAEFTKGISKSDQAALTFAKNAQDKFDQVDRKTKQVFKNFAAGALGAVASITGINSAVNQFNAAIDTLADLSALSQRTGIAVETLSQLDRVIRDTGGDMEQTVVGIEKLSQGMSRVEGPSNRVLNALDAVDVQTRNLDGTLRDSGDVFVDLSKRLDEYQDGASKTALVMDIFGESGAKLLPVMNNVAARIDDTAVSSTEAALQAEAYNNAVGTLSRRFDDLFTTVSAQVLPTLLSIVEAMGSSTKATTSFSAAGEALAFVFKGLSVSAVTIVGAFKLLGEQIGGRASQLVALANLDFKGASKIGDELSKSFDRIKNDVGDTIDSILNADVELAEAIETTGKKQLEFTAGAVTGTDRLVESIKGLNSELKNEEDALIREGRALTLALDPLARYNSEIDKLNNLLNAGAISQDIFEKELVNVKKRFDEATDSVENISNELVETENVAQVTFESISEFAIQGARSIQTALSDALFEGIKGFKSFADSALDIIKRLGTNIASVKILEGLGVGSLLGVQPNAAGGLSNAFGSGGSLINSFSTSGVGQFLGLSQLSQGPVSVPTLTGAGSALTSFANGALPVIGAGALGIGIGSTIAGDKKIFGANGTVTSAAGAAAGAAIGSVLPGIGTAIGAGLGGLVGGVVNKVFGRGPLENQNARLLGDINAAGFEGVVNTRFKAEGGLARSDRTDNVILDTDTGELLNQFKGLRESGISSSLQGFVEEARTQIFEIGNILDQGVQGFSESLRGTAEVLGLGTQSLEGFSREIDIVSEKGEFLSEQQIAQTLSDVGDHMANVLLPGLQDMVRDGETAFTALARITQEFTSLEDALIVFGVSAQDANTAISALSVSTRTELVDAAGGVEALNSQVTFFANNFLSAEEQLAIGTAKLDAELSKLGVATDITVEEFKELILSVTQAGGASVELVSALLLLAPTLLSVRDAEAQLAAESQATAPTVDNLTGSVDNLGGAADGAAVSVNNTAATIQASFARIDTARANLQAAEQQLAVARSRSVLSSAQNELSAANAALSTAQSNLSAAQSAEQQRQSAAQQSVSDEINEIISQRSELISAYQQEASALKGVVDRFGALSDKILDFKDSLAISNLSPFSPGEQLAIARQQFNATRSLAAQGDEGALDRLPEVSRTFLEASKTFNGATGAFESDFNFVQQVLESSGATARATRDIASEQLAGIEGTISELQALNGAAQDQVKALGQISSGIGSVNDSVLSVDQAMVDLEAAEQRQLIAEQDVRDATRDVEAALFVQNGFIDDVGQATIQVRDAVVELSRAILQGFGNAFVRDQQIRDFVIANQFESDAFFAQAAIEAGLNGTQVIRALQPLGVTPERINTAFNGDSVRNDQIASLVDQKLAEGNLRGIYDAASANGINFNRLAESSRLSLTEIESYARANGLPFLDRGTDFVTRGGLAMLHPAETVGPASGPRELKEEVSKMRQEMVRELAQLRREQNQQTIALINTTNDANSKSAKEIAKSNKDLISKSSWLDRSKPKAA